MPVTYHDTRDVDVDQLKALLAEAAFTSGGFARERIARIVTVSWRVVSARRGDTLVGFARAIGDGVSLAYVGNVVVREADRGQGIGREMMRRLLDGADEVTFALHAEVKNHPFYGKHGFVQSNEMLRRVRIA